MRTTKYAKFTVALLAIALSAASAHAITRAYSHSLSFGTIPPHCGQSLQSVIPIMISEPIAITTGQINGNSFSTPTRTGRTRSSERLLTTLDRDDASARDAASADGASGADSST